jgi:deazaflavin-dependent oxidoreductase (nitroreductase family)
VSKINDIERPAGTFEWVKEHRDLYLASGGTKGHIMDITGADGYPFGTHCMIRYQGRKSGRTMINALCYGVTAGEVVICASKGGAPDSPQWYHNILASEAIDFQIATQAFRATWREPAGAEREKVWAMMVDCFPFYATYQTRTDRQIPLVMLKSIASVPVFSRTDLSPAKS